MRNLLILLLTVLIPALTAGAQDVPAGFLVRHWDDDHGLPASSVTAMVRTRDGYLWVGTPNGLTRFDGDRFLETVSAPARFLRGHEILHLAEDARGALWAATANAGLFCLTNGLLTGPAMPMSPAAISALAADGANGVLAAGGGGIRRWSAGRWTDWETNGLPSTNVTKLVCDADGVAWCLADGRPFFLRGTRWQAPAEPSLRGRSFSVLARAAQNGVWLAASLAPDNRGFEAWHLRSDGTLAGTSRFAGLSGGFRSRLTALAEDRDGGLWLGTYGAGVFYCPAGGEWREFTASGPLAELIVYSIVADEEGSVWLGLQAGGLYQIRRAPVTVLHLPASARQNVVQSACGMSDGSVWVGTDGAGAFHYQNGQFIQYGTNAGLPGLNVGVLLQDSHGNLWAGTDRGLARFDGEKFRAVDVPGVKGTLVLTLLEDHRGDIWAGTQYGVVRVTTDGTEPVGPVAGLPVHYVIALAADSEGRIWAAVPDVGLFHQTATGFKPFALGQWPEENAVRSLWCDPDNTLWVACYNKGLVRIKDGRMRRWTTADGLPSDGIHGVIGDGAGNLWMASDNGIFAVAESALENYRPGDLPLLCRHVSVADGLSSKVCTGFAQPMIGRTPDGRFWFPNRQALAVFDPRRLPVRPASCLPVVSQVLADGEPLVLTDGEARASARVRRLEIHYTAPDLTGGDRLRFCYWLAGADDGWVNAGKRRVAYYNHLPPGRYEFKLKMGGPDGRWVESAQDFFLTLQPQWWQLRWVQALLALLAAGGIAAAGWGLARARARRKLREYELRAGVERERRRIAQDLHDELGAGFTHLMLLADAAGGAGQISRFAQQLAATTDQIVWTLNPRNDSLPSLVGYLSDFAQTLLRSSTVACRLDIAPELPPLAVGANLRHQLLLAFKEALNNVLKHARATEVWVRVRVTPGELRVSVEDNGVGFDAKRPSFGNGLGNLRERIEAVGGRTEISSRPGQGARVTFILPLEKAE